MLTCLVAVLAALSLKTQAACPDEPGKNVLENGGFQADKDSIAPWMVTSQGSGRPPNAGLRSPGYKSSRAFGTGPAKTRAQRFIELSQNWSACPNQEYILTFRYKFVNNKYPNSAIIYSPMGDLFQGIRSPKKKLNNEWIHFQQYFINGTGPTIFTDLSNTKKGEIFIDDVRIYPQGAVKPRRRAKSLIKNGGFETGNLGPWKGHTTKYCKVGGNGRHSKHAFNCNFPEQDVTFPVATLYQKFPTKRFGRYLMSFDYKHNTSAPHTLCEIDFGTDDLSKFPNIEKTKKGNGPWYHYKHGVIAQTTATKLQIMLSSNSPSGSCEAAIDNVSFKPVKE